MNKRSLASLTKYPSIFQDCYWGDIDETNGSKFTNVVKNRNRFVEEYKIITFVNNTRPEDAISIFDHCELYKCKEGYVYILSPYYFTRHDIAQKFGLRQYIPLYAETATTYIIYFGQKVSFNKFLKNATVLSRSIEI